MNRAPSILAAVFAAVSAQGAAVVQQMSDVQFWVGSGDNAAVIIIDWQDSKTIPGEAPLGQALAWGFRWQSGETKVGLDALMAIDAADPRLDLEFVPFGFGQLLFGAYHDLDGDGGTANFDTAGELGSASDPDDHFREGYRFNGFWGYVVGAQAGATLPAWQDATSGASTRVLSNGSWDAWVFSEDLAFFEIPDPVAAAALPVPEPSVAGIALAALAGLAIRRRR